MRTIFGYPIREDTTAEFHPDPVTVEEFVKQRKEDLDEFLKNMLNHSKMKQATLFPEEWVETFCAWSEIEPDWKQVETVKELLKWHQKSLTN